MKKVIDLTLGVERRKSRIILNLQFTIQAVHKSTLFKKYLNHDYFCFSNNTMQPTLVIFTNSGYRSHITQVEKYCSMVLSKNI